MREYGFITSMAACMEEEYEGGIWMEVEYGLQR